MSDRPRLFAGAMSGTSADGVDVALVQVAGRGLAMSATLLHHHYRPFDKLLRQAILDLRMHGETSLSALARLGSDISLTYAAAVNEALLAHGLAASQIDAIAAHGQTLFHDPPLTMQWLDPALLAAETGCRVVSDFRRADCAAGGQGAPLVPFADYVLFRSLDRHRILLNIGGIANLTSIPAGEAPADVLAFDTGPGNCISDDLLREHGGPAFDAGGALALRGTASPQLVQRVLGATYFHALPPKSTDGPAMIRLFRSAVAEVGGLNLGGLLASAAEIGARAVLDAIARLPIHGEHEVIASGGGIHNGAFMGILRAGGLNIRTSDELGVPSGAKEALAFALLGAATLDGEPSNLPSVTGARRPVVLGSITPAPAALVPPPAR